MRRETRDWEAQTAAIDAWKRAASALEEANGIQVRLSAEAVARERHQRRFELGDAVRRWYSEEYARVASGESTTDEQREQRRTLEARLTSSGERAGSLLIILLDSLRSEVGHGDIAKVAPVIQRGLVLVREWVADPDAFWETHNTDISRDDLVAEFIEVAAAWEARMKAQATE